MAADIEHTPPKKIMDTIVKINGMTLQHGVGSNRVYLMSIGSATPEECMGIMEELATENAYTKIFAKIPGKYHQDFMRRGYIEEAQIPGLYAGEDSGIFLGKYLESERMKIVYEEEMEIILKAALGKQKTELDINLKRGYKIRKCAPADTEEMSALYSAIFKSYPFPIKDRDYILETMKSHVNYYCIEYNEKIVALSSAELDASTMSAEMTDFATTHDHLGRGLATNLLAQMESDIRKLGLRTAYTIARAFSYGMNITFSKMGYTYCGRLVNNTNISGSIETMNVWYKTLRA